MERCEDCELYDYCSASEFLYGEPLVICERYKRKWWKWWGVLCQEEKLNELHEILSATKQ